MLCVPGRCVTPRTGELSDSLNEALPSSPSLPRRGICSVSPDLVLRYEAISGLEDGYDPLGYTLTLGENAPDFSESPWEFEMDMELRTFLWEGPPESLDDALRQLHAIHHAYTFQIQDRETQ